MRPSLLSFPLLVLLGTVLAGPLAMAIEQPSFSVVERDGRFELRDYSSYLLAETRVESDFFDAGNIAFGRLFRYISGNNARRESISMTAPVTQAPASAPRGGGGGGGGGKGEKIAMTAPVNQAPAPGGGFMVGFVVPSKYSRATVPQPLDPAVSIREVPAQRIASWRYSGRWTEANFRAAEGELRAALKKRGLVASGDAQIARYDPPFMPTFLRRNEVLLPVRAASAAGLPAASAEELAEAASRASRLQSELGARLQSAMASGGPVAAIEICRTEAPAIAARLSTDGWRVRRVGTRVRNPESGTPDDWERGVLAQFARRLAEGEAPESISAATVIGPSGSSAAASGSASSGGSSTLRWMRPIVTAPLCLTCHGAPEAQSAELLAALQRAYPRDAATGYAPGELRGAFTVSHSRP